MKKPKTNQTNQNRFSYDDLQALADTVLLFQADPKSPEVQKELEAGLKALLAAKNAEDPSLSFKEALEELSGEFAERIEELSGYLDALEEEGPEVWEDRWAEAGLALDFDTHCEGLEDEIAVNQDVGLLLDALSKA